MIDPKKIEEWNRLAALTRAAQSVGAPGAEPDSLPVVAAEAIEALLAERSELLAEAERLRAIKSAASDYDTVTREAEAFQEAWRLHLHPPAAAKQALLDKLDAALEALRDRLARG